MKNIGNNILVDLKNSINSEQKLRVLEQILQLYYKHYHLPYVWGGSSVEELHDDEFDPIVRSQKRYLFEPDGAITSGLPLRAGLDCGGKLRLALYSEIPILNSEKKTVNNYFALLKEEAVKVSSFSSLNNLEPLDLLFFGLDKGDGKVNFNHVGIYLDDGYMIHSSRVKPADYVNITSENWDEWNSIVSNIDLFNGRDDKDRFRGGIHVQKINDYEVPFWEKPYDVIEVISIIK